MFGLVCLVLVFGFLFVRSAYRVKQVDTIGLYTQWEKELFVRPHSQILGSDDAKVTLVEFMDPACVSCAAFSPLLKQMLNRYPGKLKLVIRYAPFQKGAENSIKILEAAKKQGKYWQTLELLLSSQSEWANHHNPQSDTIWQLLPQAGVDVDKIRKDMDDPKIAAIIKQDMADAKTLNVRRTPGFFVNGRPLQNFGAKPLRELIKSEIIAHY